MHRFCEAARTSAPVIRRCFPGGYPEFLAAAGLGARYVRSHLVDESALMEELARLERLSGREPTVEDVKRRGWIRPDTYRRKIGGWRNVSKTYARWKAQQPADPRPGHGARPAWRAGAAGEQGAVGGAGAVVGAQRAEGEGGVGAVERAAGAGAVSGAGELATTRKERAEGVRGEPLGFRGLLHAPINELGVIHLFGLLAGEHSLAVEHIGHAYPDCRALRPEPGSPGRWRRIAVEFEYRSSNFRAHGHNPALCDLIVCWDHDWPECPVEVLELRGLLRRVSSSRSRGHGRGQTDPRGVR
ncbi:MAG: hypothetical protein WD749_01300 [Phycisphaerales bacterium]